jgi:prepilin-type N-terminal cleavage/methylation domain-containing protein
MLNNTLKKNIKNKQSGFTLIEMVIAILVLTIGLIGTAAAITYSLQFTTLSRNVSEAKQVIVGSIEEIESLRNSRRLDFKQIANVGNVNNDNVPTVFNGFSVGFRDVSINPGSDGVHGTNDDPTNPNLIRQGFRRQITITNLSDTLKKIEVKVQYAGTNGGLGELTGVCYLNDEARVTR